MSWTRRRPPQTESPPNQPYSYQDDMSVDSLSDEIASTFVAYFSLPKNKPETNTHALAKRQQQLIQQHPTAIHEINAISYYYGLFVPADHIAYDPAINRYLGFFDPDLPDLSHPDITSFRNDLSQDSEKHHKDY